MNRDIETMDKYAKVTRLEVIDETGRAYTHHEVRVLQFSLQDDDRTLKIFVTKEAYSNE